MGTPPEGLIPTRNTLYTNLDISQLWVDLGPSFGYVRLAKYSDVMSSTTTVNSSTTPLTLAGRGYYNYTGAVNGTWDLPPASTSQGMFYRIYNKASNGTSTLDIVADGAGQLFRGGILEDNIVLDYAETLTLVCDGTDWNVYS